jgi:hypothetical protein
MTNSLVTSSIRLVIAVIRLLRSLSAFFRRSFKAVRWRSPRRSQQRENDPENFSRSDTAVADLINGEEIKSPSRRRASDATTATRMSEAHLSQLQIPIVVSPNPASPGDKDPVHTPDADVSVPSSGPTVGKKLWKTAIRNVKMQSTLSGEKLPPQPFRHQSLPFPTQSSTAPNLLFCVEEEMTNHRSPFPNAQHRLDLGGTYRSGGERQISQCLLVQEWAP